MSDIGFSKPVKLTLGQRAAYLCNNPGCRKLTVGPHSEITKSLITGEAAHISAEAEGGPRYNATQTDTERNGIGNGIWLCTECHTKIDKDPASYPVEKLLTWREQHELYVSHEGWRPDLPSVTLNPVDGLTTNIVGATKFTAEDFANFRDHTLTLRNTNSVPIYNFSGRLQFPEEIIARTLRVPVGVNALFRGEEFGGWIVRSKSGAGGAETYMPPKQTYSNCVLQLDRLNPTLSLEILLRSIGPTDEGKIPGNPDQQLPFYLQGTFQYEWKGIFYQRSVVMPIEYDLTTRGVSSLPVGEDAESLGYKLVSVFKLI
jgi:hypothetical protein